MSNATAFWLKNLRREGIAPTQKARFHYADVNGERRTTITVEIIGHEEQEASNERCSADRVTSGEVPTKSKVSPRTARRRRHAEAMKYLAADMERRAQEEERVRSIVQRRAALAFEKAANNPIPTRRPPSPGWNLRSRGAGRCQQLEQLTQEWEKVCGRALQSKQLQRAEALRSPLRDRHHETQHAAQRARQKEAENRQRLLKEHAECQAGTDYYRRQQKRLQREQKVRSQAHSHTTRMQAQMMTAHREAWIARTRLTC